MAEEAKQPYSIAQGIDSNSASSDSPLEENKHEEAKNADSSIFSNPDLTSSLAGLDYSTITQLIETESMRPRKQSVDSDKGSIDEVVLKRAIPGKDGRELVSDTTKSPYSAHGRIIMYYKEGEILGSGTLIGPRHVLTAAHNLRCNTYKSQPLSVVFIPGLNGDSKPFGEIKVKRYFYPFEYERHPNEDYGLIELEEDIGESTGYIQMKALRADEVDNLEIYLYGYPSHIDEKYNFRMYGMKGRARVNESNCLIYELDASNGQSGSSIYYYSPEDGKYYTIGVHKDGYNTHNEGVFLTPERIDQIQKWMDNKVLDTAKNLKGLTEEVYGRESELMRLRSSMRFDKELSVIALTGVTGIGKSTIALKFLDEASGSYHYIWWIDCTTEDTFIDSVIALADKLGIENVTYQDMIASIKDLINSSDLSFLFIFDNLQDEQVVRDFIMAKGHYIITTRLVNIEYEKIEVGSLSEEASVKLLSNKLTKETHEELESLADFLQGHPYALYQSADYISRYKGKLRVDQYIASFSNAIKNEFNSRQQNKITKLKNILNSSISSLSEESRHILKIVCIGYCDNIPYNILYEVFRYTYPDISKTEFDRYMDEITRESIVT